MTTTDDVGSSLEEIQPNLWKDVEKLCHDYIKLLSPNEDENSMRIKAALEAILDHTNQLLPLYRGIAKIAPNFDFDANTPANGYRSFLILVDKFMLYSHSTFIKMNTHKYSLFLHRTNYTREVEACSQLLGSLVGCFQCLTTLTSFNEQTQDGTASLFLFDNYTPKELLLEAENINQYSFYGRCLGFQFASGLRRILKTISVCMASYSEAYYNNGTFLGRCANSVKYLLDPESRARRIVNLSHHADISFCQSFWFLNENAVTHTLPSMVMPSIAINQIISIPPEDLTISTLDDTPVSIPIPCSHIGKKPIHVRLISSKRRVGMVGSGSASGELLDPSKTLLIHCHGGGFVAQTSRSHESYLRKWALKLDAPILSIDYSLAPEAPYPRALEEILYAYAWALNHSSTLLGTTAQKVILIGDSAGANLNLGLTLKSLEYNIRKPDGIFMAYTPVLIEFIPSPARLLCVTDPLLPFGFLMRCMKAYATVENRSKENQTSGEDCEEVISDTESFAEVSESDLIALALSPNDDATNDAQKLASLPSDSTLNSVSLAEVDGTADVPECSKNSTETQKIIDKDKNKRGVDKNWSIFNWSLNGGMKKDMKELDLNEMKIPIDEFLFTVPRDPYLSPYLASDSILSRMPPTKILTLELDPCLDDCVMFAKKLKSLGNEVTLDVLPDLPHGFLNLSTVSKEASEGSKLCVKRIQELMDLP